MVCVFSHPKAKKVGSVPEHGLLRISSLANIDSRLTEVLRRIRDGEWSYARGSPKHRTLLGTLAEQLGYPPSWGDPTILPANGGLNADIIWKELGVTGRKGVGGVPCNIVHGDVGNAFGGVGASCLGNAGIRGLMGFLQALVIYAPVCLYLIPLMPSPLTDPHTYFCRYTSSLYYSLAHRLFSLFQYFARQLSLFFAHPYSCPVLFPPSGTGSAVLGA